MACALLRAVNPLAGADGTPSPLDQAREIQTAIRNIGHSKSPAIVAIRATRRIPAPPQADGVVTDDEQLVAINGAGTIVRADGLILTNEHVIQRAADLLVTLHDGRRLRAEVVASDHRGDLAIIKIDQTNLPTVNFCDWSDVALGDWVVAVGNPMGLAKDGQLSVSVGVLANFNRRLPALGNEDDRLYYDMLQFTAGIYPGNSGGPLLNLNGELVGIVTAMHVRAADDAPLSFALPITPQRRETIERLCGGRPIEYGYVGLRVRENLASPLESSGVIVESIDKQGPAQRVGLSPGDQLLRCNGRPILAPSQFAALVGETPVGQSLEIEVVHEGDARRVELPVERREPVRVSKMKADLKSDPAAASAR